MLKVRSIKVTLHGKSLGVPEMAGPMSAAVIKGALNLLLAQEVNYACIRRCFVAWATSHRERGQGDPSWLWLDGKGLVDNELVVEGLLLSLAKGADP